MKHNIYQDAVDHLEFSENLYEMTARNAGKGRSRYRLLRNAILAAVMVCILATSALAVSPEFRKWTVSVLHLGVSRQETPDTEVMPKNKVMEFQHNTQIGGVSIHSLELDRANYSISHGMLTSPHAGYLRITEDYQLEGVELDHFCASMEKNGRNYSFDFSYYESEKGIFSTYKDILQKNDQGEVFLNFTDGNSNQWPVYVNLASGSLRDALPGWTENDFPGRVCYAYELRGGILVAILADEHKIVNGNSASYNQLYWIKDGTKEAVLIHLPEEEYGWYCENDALYCKNIRGHLFRMNDAMEFELLYDYETGDDLTNGLYTVATENGELSIIDVYTGDIYTVPSYSVDPGKPDGFRVRSGGDIDETMGYNAIRYSKSGAIALVQTDWVPEEERVALRKLGILDRETGEIKLLEIENDYDGYTIRWLDEYRLAVIYDQKYLCIYEFEK